ncbi:putative cystathionine gamma-synthase 2 [Arabidopsis thaliana]
MQVTNESEVNRICCGFNGLQLGERLRRDMKTSSITTPVVNTTTYFFKDTTELIDFKEKRIDLYEYARYGNPTTMALEEKISALEGAESTLVMASGMYASNVMLLALVPTNGHIVATKDCYKETTIFMENFLTKLGITVTFIDSDDIAGLKTLVNNHEVSLFFTESPTNPGTLVCIDATIATPINQKTLALGADLVHHSATKYIGGHNDVLAGSISGSMELVSKIRNLHKLLGGTLNPNAAYLLIRGMKTMHLRVRQQNSTGMKMAQVLEAHPKVSRVYYLGLPSHPEHLIAKRQMTGIGGLVSFEIDGDLKTTIKFIDALKIPYLAASFGGCESLVDQLATGIWDIPREERLKDGFQDNLVRFSFGIEDFEDIKADVLHALETI